MADRGQANRVPEVIDGCPHRLDEVCPIGTVVCPTDHDVNEGRHRLIIEEELLHLVHRSEPLLKAGCIDLRLIKRLIGFQWGVTVASRSQLGLPAYRRARIR